MKWFNADKGFGFAVVEDGEQGCFHPHLCRREGGDTRACRWPASVDAGRQDSEGTRGDFAYIDKLVVRRSRPPWWPMVNCEPIFRPSVDNCAQGFIEPAQSGASKKTNSEAIRCHPAAHAYDAEVSAVGSEFRAPRSLRGAFCIFGAGRNQDMA